MTMTDTTSTEAAVQAEDEGFYHESGLNATWTGSRLAIGGLSFLFGAFAFAYFYLQSSNSHGKWFPTGTIPPHMWTGATIMGLVVVSALVQTFGLQRIKAGQKQPWVTAALAALLLGLAAVALQIQELLVLPFQPAADGFASVFVGFYPVYLTLVFCVMVWLEILIIRCRAIPQISFVEQPPTFAEAFAVQRFQAGLSAFTATWNYMAVVAIIAWILFYLVH
jgi:heme/copper-type cytochrome/quinol oxidase subunit 3